MGIRLIVEVLDHAPAEFTTAERLVLIVYAEDANDGTRTGWPPDELVAHRTGLTVKGVRKVLRRLRDRGYDPRVVLRIGKDDRPVYAWRGHGARYRIPSFPQRQVPITERATPEGKPFEQKGFPQEAERVPPGGTKGLPMGGTPSPQSPQSPQSARARDDKLLAAIADELQRQTGREFDDTWYAKVRDTIFNGQPVDNREAYARSSIRKDPRRFIPTSQPPRFHDGKWSS